ncbi:pimeloyl-ACP methyl ester carboxylesterase [Bradyrhizobium sp. USDA 4369]
MTDRPAGVTSPPPGHACSRRPDSGYSRILGCREALYDAGDIRAPVLLVHAEWDRHVPIASALDFLLRLKHAPYRRWVEIGEATHMVLLEKDRWQAF